MSNVTGLGTTFNLPNYSGMLATASPTKTPFISLVLRKPIKDVAALEFSTMSDYTLPDPSADGISENAAADIMTNVDATNIVRGQKKNIIQTFVDKLSISYPKEAANAQMAGLNIAGQKNNAPSELDFQRSMIIKKNAVNIEYAFLNGAYAVAANANQANKTRGMFAAVAAANLTDLEDNELTRENFEGAIKTMYDNGAYLDDVIIFVDSNAKQKLSRIYEATAGFGLPVSRNVGGVNIYEIVTDFGTFSVVIDQFIPKGKILFADMTYIQAVGLPTKGSNFYFEELAKTGASYSEMFYGNVGLDHGPDFCHGAIVGINYDSPKVLKEVSATSIAGGENGETLITVTTELSSPNNKFYYKAHATAVAAPEYGDGISGWTKLTANPATLTITNETKIRIVEVADAKIIGTSGEITLVVKS